MSEKDSITFETTVNAVLKKTHDRAEFEKQMRDYGFDDKEEFIEAIRQAARQQITKAFEDDSLELLMVHSEEAEEE